MLYLYFVGLSIAGTPETLKNWILQQPSSTLDIIEQTNVLPKPKAKELQNWSHQKIADELSTQLKNLPQKCTPWFRFKTPHLSSTRAYFP